MFTHVGMLTLVPEATDADRRSIIEGLSGLVGRIDGLTGVQAGYDLGLREGNADVVFFLTFESQDAWQAYQDDEEHKAIVRDRILPVLAAKAFVQAADLVQVASI